jgi:hypothetical protein
MGLSIFYHLRLPGHLEPAAVDAVLQALHTRAAAMGFATLTEITSLSDHSSWDPASGRPIDWLEFFATGVAEPLEDEEPPLIGRPETARGFLFQPGAECEPATVAFLHRGDASGAHQEWYWWCACKTQYASLLSEDHFVRCHRGIVALLDVAVSLGVEVDVGDEGEYWETRDEQVLLSHLRRMNHIMAALAGHLSDALGPERSVEAAIFAHPDFEHLEMGPDGCRNQ